MPTMCVSSLFRKRRKPSNSRAYTYGISTPATEESFGFKNNSTPDTPPAYEQQPPPHRVPTDDPPPYTAPVTATADDPFYFLSKFDTIFLVDDSGSMAGSRWRECRQALMAITPICVKHDADGIDVCFLNATRNNTRHIQSATEVENLFNGVRAYGGTMTGTNIQQIIDPYLERLENSVNTYGRTATFSADSARHIKPINLIVITDGEASDDPESVIKDIAKQLDDFKAPAWQIGIQFFQVGNDPEATRALRELDDGLIGCRDIVDTVKWTGNGSALSSDGILKVVMGAVNRKIDRRDGRVR